MNTDIQQTDHLDDDTLNAWIDDAVSSEEGRRIQDHLDACPACRSAVESLRLVKQMLAALPDPELPRSFQLTPEQARKPEPIRTTVPTSSIVRLLPVVRALSIAAVLALLVLGGAAAFGPLTDAFTDSNDGVTTQSVTDQAAGASEETYPARRAIAPGEVIDQGQAASSSNSGMSAMSNGLQQTDQGTSDERSALEIATLSTGIVAALLIGFWILLSNLARTRPVAQEAPASRK